MSRIDNLFERVIALLGCRPGSSEFESFVADCGVEPVERNDENESCFEFRSLGCMLLSHEKGGTFTCASFVFDNMRARVNQWTKFEGPLPFGIDEHDTLASSLEKIATPPIFSRIYQSKLDKSVWHLHVTFEYGIRLLFLSFFADTGNISSMIIQSLGSGTKEISPINFEPSQSVSSVVELLGFVAERYSTCQTYQDHGFLQSVYYLRRGGDRRALTCFRTLFKRPEHLLFEWLDIGFDVSSTNVHQVCAFWCNDTGCGYDISGEKREFNNLISAIEQIYTVPSPVPIIIPTILFDDVATPDQRRIHQLILSPAEAQNFSEQCDNFDKKYWEVMGIVRPSAMASLKVDKHDFGVQQVLVSNFAMGNFEHSQLNASPVHADGFRTSNVNLFEFQSRRFDVEIADSKFSWQPYSMSRLDWEKRLVAELECEHS